MSLEVGGVLSESQVELISSFSLFLNKSLFGDDNGGRDKGSLFSITLSVSGVLA